MKALRTASAVLSLMSGCVLAAVDVGRTFTLLREGEKLSAAAAAELESEVAKKPSDLENRLRLLSYYAGQGASVRDARARHVLWLIQNEPKAAVFMVATRVYAIQPTGGPLADPAGFQAVREAWRQQIAKYPNDAKIKRNAVDFLDVHDPEAAEALLQSTGDARWLGQIYANAILGVDATEYRTSEPASTSDEKRNSTFAKHALAELERSNNSVMLGGAGFTLCRDGGFLYADGKLDWDYTPLAKKLLAKAEHLDPSNADAFSVVPELPKRGERPAVTVRAGGDQIAHNLKKRVLAVVPPGVRTHGAVVRVNVLIGLDGTVVRTAAVSGPSELHNAAAAAVKQWTFSPTTMNGKQVYVLSAIDLKF